ncbi:tRNA pseudouridine(38-40) synthase TruA [Candidatus Babeliales bacterium]|nr:tRNA pseudouridine(38-40) synthase TruA [Candidatus Babeliales bacterium]
MRHTYKLTVAYDGANYHGWQEQQGYPSIYGALAETFQATFNVPCRLFGASRTDAGVHALGQVVRLQTDLEIDSYRLMDAWNNRLPEAMVIRDIQQVDASFHPCHNVKQKTYWYHVFTERPVPFFVRYGWYVRLPLNKKKLHDALQVFIGEHDFRSFISTGEDYESTVKTIDSIEIEQLDAVQGYRIIVKGHSFLHHMVRRLVGAAVHVATHEHLSTDDIHRALAEKDPNQILPNAPAQGLMLHSIVYEE